MTVQAFRKKPVEVEAMHIEAITTQAIQEVTAWCPNAYLTANEGWLMVSTRYGEVKACRGNWLVKDSDGGFLLRSADAFLSDFEPA